MKKLIALIFTISLLLSLFACTPNESTTKINVGYLAGPTGMGMAKLIHDNGGVDGNDKYSFTKFAGEAPVQLARAALANKTADVVCLPTDNAATFAAQDSSLIVLSVNTLGSVYLIAKTDIDSIENLEGKTIHTCISGTPKKIIEYILEESGVNATVSTEYNGNALPSPDSLKTVLADSGCTIEFAVAPEPIVTQVTSQNNSYKVELNLNTVWNGLSDTALTMGCIVSTKEFVKNNKKAVDDFLNEYKASIEFVNAQENVDAAAEYIVEAGVMGQVGPAKKALNNLRGSIAYLDGADMKAALIGFYNAIGVALPDEGFYYAK